MRRLDATGLECTKVAGTYLLGIEAWCATIGGKFLHLLNDNPVSYKNPATVIQLVS
jgi:hypothetical protein